MLPFARVINKLLTNDNHYLEQIPQPGFETSIKMNEEH